MIHAVFDGNSIIGFQTFLATAVLMAIVLCLRWPVAKKFGAKASYALWAIPFMRFVLPPLPEKYVPLPQAQDIVEKIVGLGAVAPVVETHQTQGLPVQASTQTVRVPEFDSIHPLWAFISDVGWLNGMMLAWAAGVIISLAILFYRQNRFSRIVFDNAEPASIGLTQAFAAEVKSVNLRRTPQIALSTVSGSPLVTGVLRPIILLPTWFEDEYTPQEQRAMLAHEITHVKRLDLWALQLAQIFVALQWFNPIAYIAFRAFRSDQEAACDADVLRNGAISAHSYSSTLLKVVRNTRPVRPQVLVAGLPLTHSIKERFILMQNSTPTLKTRLLGTVMIAVFGTCAVFVSANSVAHPTFHPSSSSFSFDDDHFIVDGKEITDRRFVLLSDPVEGLGIDKFIDMIEDKDFSKLSELADMEIFDDFPQMQSLTKLADLDFSEFKFEQKDGKFVFSMPSDGIDLSGLPNVFNLKEIEAWADKIEVEAEAFGARIEEKFDGEFGDKITDLVEDHKILANKCVDLSIRTLSKPVIVKYKSHGKTLRGVCVKGDGKDLYSDKTEAFIRKNKRLTDAEKERFFDGRGNNKNWDVNWSRD